MAEIFYQQKTFASFSIQCTTIYCAKQAFFVEKAPESIVL